MRESITDHFAAHPEEVSAHKQEAGEKLEVAIAHLPDELRARWTEKYEEAEDLASFKKEFDEFMQKRGNALEHLETFPIRSELVREEIKPLVSVVSRTFGDANYFLGNGRTAEVYELPTAQHLCVKYIYDQDAYNEGNHIRVEYGFLCALATLRGEHVRTPVPAFLRIHPKEGHVYGMEKVNGKSLSQIIEKPEENEELIHVIAGLDREKVKSSVVSYIEKMHEMKITHNDLFMRNIMVDQDGNFFIIDFGKAKYEEIGEDRSEERRRDLFLANNELSVFFNKLDILERK